MADERITTDPEAAADAEFAAFMLARGHAACRGCGRVFDRGDVSWNSPCTEAGTDYTAAQIICEACGREAEHWQSWYPGADSWPEFVANVLGDMPEARRDR